MPEQNERRSLLQKLLGQAAGSKIEHDLKQIAETLDKAQIKRKEFSDAVTEPVNKAIMEDLANSIDELLAGITDSPPEGLRNQIIATVMGSIADMGTDEPPAEEVDMAEGEEEDDEEPMPEQLMELTKEVTALAKESHAIYDDLHEFLPTFVEAYKVVKELAPLAKQAKELTALQARFDAIEKQLSQRPRRASEDESTVVTGEAADTIQKDIEKSTDGQEFTWGGLTLKKGVN